MAAAKFFDFYEQMKKPRSSSGGGAASKPPSQPAGAGEPLTVSQLTYMIEAALRERLPQSLLVQGEVSNFNHHRGSGHAYFTLKDAETCIDCVMFKSDFSRVKFTPQDGMQLLARGRIGVYGQRGRYQLYVSRFDPLGQGALELAFRQLCEKLEREGLFRPERKKPIPAFPLRIALVTSTQTAAIQDMFKVLRSFPWVKLYVYDVPVQGDGAAQRMAASLSDLGRLHQTIGGIDLILLGRGGGSLEDLWEFNEEVLARAIVACPIPIISGVGHEVDVTIADLVADLRAHTPTEAAQVAIANWRSAPEIVATVDARLRRELGRLIQHFRQRLGEIERHAMFRRPKDRVDSVRQMLDERQRVLSMVTNGRLRSLWERALRLGSALHERSPRHAMALAASRLEQLAFRLHRGMIAVRKDRVRQLTALHAQLNALGPHQVLKRGYTITTLRKTGAIVRRAGDLKVGERIITRFSDGTTQSVVEDQRQLPLFE